MTLKLVSSDSINFISTTSERPYMISPNKMGRLTVSNRKLVLQERKYPLVENSVLTTIWESTPYPDQTLDPPFLLRLRTDGNLILFSQQHGLIVWQTKTANVGTAPYTFEILNSGEMVIKDKNGTVTWSSGTFFSSYLVDDPKRLVGYYNPGALKSYNYLGNLPGNRVLRSAVAPTSASVATIFGSFSQQANFAIRINDQTASKTAGLQIMANAVVKTISFWYYVTTAATSVEPACLIDIPGVGSITSQFGVSSGLLTSTCMINGGPLRDMLFTYADLEKKGMWTNFTLVLETPLAANIAIVLFNNSYFTSGANCLFGPVVVYSDALQSAENAANYYFFQKYFQPLRFPVPLPFELDRINHVYPDADYEVPATASTVPRSPEDCRQLALQNENKYAGWLFINDTHWDPKLRNTCKLLLRTSVNQPVNRPFRNMPEIQRDMFISGCSKIGERPEWSCKSLPPGIDVMPGLSTATRSVSPSSATPMAPSDCRLIALDNPTYKGWAFNTQSARCVFYTEDIKPIVTDYSAADPYVSGCKNSGELVSLGCKIPQTQQPSSPSPSSSPSSSSPQSPSSSSSSFPRQTTSSLVTSEIINLPAPVISNVSSTFQSELQSSSIYTSSKKVDESESSTTSTNTTNSELLKWVFVGIGILLFFVLVIVMLLLSRKKK